MTIELYQYGRPDGVTYSPPCGKAQMALRFKRQRFTIRSLMSPSQVKKINPRGRVPFLRIDGQTFPDSSELAAELDRRFPDPPLAPSDPARAAEARLLEDWVDDTLYWYLVYLRWIVPDNWALFVEEIFAVLPAPVRWLAPRFARREVRARLAGQGTGGKPEAVVRAELEQALDDIALRLGDQPFLQGGQPTLADIAVCAFVDQVRVPALTPRIAAAADARTALVAWSERVHRHAAPATAPAPELG